LKKLNELEVWKKYRVWIANRFNSFGELEASRHFRNKQKGYLKGKFEELETNSKIKNIDLYRALMTLRRVTSRKLI
jgi:hypothetical protein